MVRGSFDFNAILIRVLATTFFVYAPDVHRCENSLIWVCIFLVWTRK